MRPPTVRSVVAIWAVVVVVLIAVALVVELAR